MVWTRHQAQPRRPVIGHGDFSFREGAGVEFECGDSADAAQRSDMPDVCLVTHVVLDRMQDGAGEGVVVAALGSALSAG